MEKRAVSYSSYQTIKGRILSTELITISLIYSARKIRAEKQAGDSNQLNSHLLDDDQYNIYQELNQPTHLVAYTSY